jgi:hypothetical protein
MQTISDAYFRQCGIPPITRAVTVRSLGLISMLCALAIGGYLFAQQMRDEGPTSQGAKNLESRASGAASTANFQAAAPVLQVWFADHGTYAGAQITPSFGVALVRADATSYCLQSGTGASAQHETGPGGSPAPGPC